MAVDGFVLVQTSAAIITALAAAGAFAYVRRGMRLLREHDRVLYGEDSVEGWTGIVPKVGENRSRSQRNRQLIAEHHDLDSDEVLWRGGGSRDD